ncbi:MAG: MFS transporter [Clostridiaceae bacterium]|nr:MFS transporter [Clostridiaceae bacterium]
MLRKDISKPIKIGSFCILTYLVSYISRNLLSVVSPELIEKNIFSKEYIGYLSSVYLVVYALGQLLNGILGDRINPKYMILTGCLLSSTGMLIFPLVTYTFIHILCFAFFGFGLSMLRGPLMKIISENTLPKEARFICVLFSVSSFLGPLVASFMAVIFQWKGIFIGTSIFAFTMGLVSFFVISAFEHKSIIVFKAKKDNIFKGISKLFTIKGFVFFLLVGSIVEIVASAVTFWIPAYLSEYIQLSKEMTALSFSIISLVKVICPFICVFLYEHLIKDEVILVGICFGFSAISFLGLLFIQKYAVLNIAALILAKSAASIASAVLWSIYIPSLAEHGAVSSGNGVLDFTGYAASAIANVQFSRIVISIGWKGLIFSRFAILMLGTLVSVIFFLSKMRKTGKMPSNSIGCYGAGTLYESEESAGKQTNELCAKVN